VNRSIKIGIVIFIAAALPVTACLVYLGSGDDGSTLQGEEEIQPGSFLDVPFTVWFENNEVSYDFAVKSGPAVDIYILSDEDYARYQAGLAVLDRGFVYENTKSVSESPYFSKGSHHAVIDNTDYGVASPAGSTVVVGYMIGPGGPPEVVYLRIALLAVAVVTSSIMFAVGVAYIVKERR
jgi:hypothetical protein